MMLHYLIVYPSARWTLFTYPCVSHVTPELYYIDELDNMSTVIYAEVKR